MLSNTQIIGPVRRENSMVNVDIRGYVYRGVVLGQTLPSPITLIMSLLL